MANPGPPPGAVVEDILGLEDAVLMIDAWRRSVGEVTYCSFLASIHAYYTYIRSEQTIPLSLSYHYHTIIIPLSYHYHYHTFEQCAGASTRQRSWFKPGKSPSLSRDVTWNLPALSGREPIPDAPCMEYLPPSGPFFGGKCRYIWSIWVLLME